MRDDGFDVRPEAAEACFDVLDMYYRDKARWGFLLQTRIMSKYTAHAPPGRLTVVERSPFSALHVFAANQLQQGFLLDVEWRVLQELYASLGWAPTAMIYISVPAEVALRRIRQRARPCEAHVGLDYVRQIDTCNKAMLDKFRAMGRTVCVLDGTKTPEQVFQEARWWLQQCTA